MSDVTEGREKELPLSVFIGAGLWIAIGAFALLACVLTLLTAFKVSRVYPETLSGGASAKTLAAGIAAGTLGLVWVTAGVSLLRRKDWARKVVRFFTALALAGFVALGLFWIIAIAASPAFGDENWFELVAAAVGVFNAAVFAVPLAILLRKLGTPVARDAMRSRAQATSPSEVGGGDTC